MPSHLSINPTYEILRRLATHEIDTGLRGRVRKNRDVAFMPWELELTLNGHPRDEKHVFHSAAEAVAYLYWLNRFLAAIQISHRGHAPSDQLRIADRRLRVAARNANFWQLKPGAHVASQLGRV